MPKIKASLGRTGLKKVRGETRRLKYRQELIIQKHLEEAKKEYERKERLQAKINVLPLKKTTRLK